MRLALDTFEVEGIGHNLPFVGAVMDHPRFVVRQHHHRLHRRGIPRRLPGRDAARPHPAPRRGRRRRDEPGGRDPAHPHFRHDGQPPRRVGDDWVVTPAGRKPSRSRIAADRDGSTVRFADGSTHPRRPRDWTPGQPLARLMVDGEPLVMKVGKIPVGLPAAPARRRPEGATSARPRQPELAQLMLEKLPPDTSKFLLCPMPGLVVRIDVAEGDEVQEGQALATVEAMKMENILQAERRGIVRKINAAPGASLKVDDVILEFE